MIKIQIKNRFTGSIIFEYEKENNTIKKTVAQYIKEEIEKGKTHADLNSADLSYADLRSADLSYADLSYANLTHADLNYANLRSANLTHADLTHADLNYANLRSANLRSANLSYANLDKRYIQVSCIGSNKRMTTYCFEDDIIWCGCFKGTLKEFEEKVNETHANNAQYLKEYLGFISYVKSLK